MAKKDDAAKVEAEKLPPGHGKFKKGLKVGDVWHKDFVLREATTADLIEAEEEAAVDKQIAFNVELLAIQLERVGTFEGPFNGQLLKTLSAPDFYRLRAAQLALEAASGEG